MPTVLRWRGYRCFFYSNDGSEPPHVHVRGANGELKIWLTDLDIAVSVGFAPHEVTGILRELSARRDELLKAWHDHFGN